MSRELQGVAKRSAAPVSKNAVLLINMGSDFEVLPCSQIFN
jgi:hypothetical protein